MEPERKKRKLKVSNKLSNTGLEWMKIHLATPPLKQICSYVEDLREHSARKIQHWFAKHMKPKDPINRWVFKDCEITQNHWAWPWSVRVRAKWNRHQGSKPRYRRFYYNWEVCEICGEEVGFLSNKDDCDFCLRNLDWMTINRGDYNMTLCGNCYSTHEFGPCHECHYEWLDDTQDCHDDMIRVNMGRDDTDNIRDPSVDALGAIFCDRTCYDTFKSKQNLITK